MGSFVKQFHRMVISVFYIWPYLPSRKPTAFLWPILWAHYSLQQSCKTGNNSYDVTWPLPGRTSSSSGCTIVSSVRRMLSIVFGFCFSSGCYFLQTKVFVMPKIKWTDIKATQLVWWQTGVATRWRKMYLLSAGFHFFLFPLFLFDFCLKATRFI